MTETVIYRTPDLCAMQQDDSDDLQAVGSILYDAAGVVSFWSFIMLSLVYFRKMHSKYGQCFITRIVKLSAKSIKLALGECK